MAATRKPRAKARGNIEKLPSGALRVRVYAGVDPITKRRYDLKEVVAPGPGAERAAQKLLTRLVHQVDERRHPKTSATVNQLLDRYLDLLKVGRTTLARYRQLADLHVRPLIGSEKAGRIDGEIIDSLYAELRRCQVHCTKKKGVVDHRTTRPHECDARCGPHQCKPLAEGTVRKVHYLLSGAFKKAVYWNWLTVSPIDQAEPPPPAPANPQPPSAAEAAAILNRAWHNDVDWGTQVWLSMVTGSRRGEVCGIRWRHVDLENGVLHMEKAIGQDGTETWEKDTKTHQDRRIVLDPATVGLLSEHWERCATRARSLGLALPKDAFVFSTKPDGSTSLRPSSVTQRYRRLVQSLNIDSTLHALRHYSATELIGAGVDIRTVAGRLGHGGGGSTTLRVYAAWLAEADQRASEALMARVPERPTPLPDPIERAKTDPEAPYERIAAQLRNETLAGDHRPGDPAPTLKALQAKHGVGTGTAHRALGLLKAWGLVEGSRGQRAVFVAAQDVESADDSPQDVEPAGNQSSPEPAAPGPTSPSALDLRLLCLGKPVRDFMTKADPNDVDHLHRLLINAARRHSGTDDQLEDYELEVRRHGESAVLATYAAL